MPSNVPPKLFVLGDSISIGYGPALERGLHGRLIYSRLEGIDEAKANLDLPKGANGGDSKRCRDYLESHLPECIQPDILLLNCGLHDVKTGPNSRDLQIDLDTYTQNLRAIIKHVQDHGVQLVWVTITPVDEARHNESGSEIWRYQEDVDRYNVVSTELMRSADVPIIDLHAFSLAQGEPAETLYDGRHFHEPVVEAQGAYIAGWLTSLVDRQG